MSLSCSTRNDGACDPMRVVQVDGHAVASDRP
jgi:hypothetical protein